MKTIISGLLMLLLLTFSGQASAQMAYDVNNAQREIWGDVSVRKQQRKAVITWNTLSEKHVSFYFAQHSIDGKEWRVIGKITPGAYNKAEQYQYAHQNPARGVNYYRLLQVDEEGNQEFSKVVALQWYITSHSIQAHPNPSFSGDVMVSTPAPGTLQVFNSAGFFVKQIEAKAGKNPLDLSKMPKGIYYIKVGEEMTSVIVEVVKEG